MQFTIEISDELFRKAIESELQSTFDSKRNYDKPPGIVVIRRQVQEVVEMLDVRSLVREMVKEYAEIVARDEIRAALKKLTKVIVKEQMEAGVLFERKTG